MMLPLWDLWDLTNDSLMEHHNNSAFLQLNGTVMGTSVAVMYML